ncbi:MAG TPA: biotin/lipoyl-containing protein [Terriglobales bacterium]|nr:biotin/lipoyl-containing protein [Terriglobales bacterium]
MIYEISIGGHEYSVELKAGAAPGEWQCRIARAGKNETPRELSFSAVRSGEEVLSLLLDGRSCEVKRDVAGQTLTLGGRRYECEVRDPRSLRSRRKAASAEHGPRKLLASMPGKVVRVLKAEGATVEAGEGVLVVEAMKMQNELKSPKNGSVKKILVAEGAAVNAGDTLAIVE